MRAMLIASIVPDPKCARSRLVRQLINYRVVSRRLAKALDCNFKKRKEQFELSSK